MEDLDCSRHMPAMDGEKDHDSEIRGHFQGHTQATVVQSVTPAEGLHICLRPSVLLAWSRVMNCVCTDGLH